MTAYYILLWLLVCFSPVIGVSMALLVEKRNDGNDGGVW